MRLVRYDFSGWNRDVEIVEALRSVRPYNGEVIYFAVAPEEGGEKVSAPVVAEVTLDELLANGEVWAADAAKANDVDVEGYRQSLVRVHSVEDFPRYLVKKEVPCVCGCGEIQWIEEVCVTEVLFRPADPKDWNKYTKRDGRYIDDVLVTDEPYCPYCGWGIRTHLRENPLLFDRGAEDWEWKLLPGAEKAGDRLYYYEACGACCQPFYYEGDLD